LGRDADGSSVRSPDKHRFDEVAIDELPEEFGGFFIGGIDDPF
jgi:hypothetical protein